MEIKDLRKLQSQGVIDFNSTLKSVEINPTELCNRKCVFCPRVDPSLYKNQKKHIDPNLCEVIGGQLEDFNFTGRIGFTGFGEPLLHPQLIDCVYKIRKCKSARWIEINTNGDTLTREMAVELAEAGCTNITISMYDNDQTEFFNEMLQGTGLTFVLRHHYNSNVNYNLNMVNRIDIIKKDKPINIKNPCYIPFYKMFIDWNGDYLLCQQDWGRTTAMYNVLTTPIEEFWISKLYEQRKDLALSKRQHSPCSHCNINGTLYGEDSFNFFVNHGLGNIN